MEGARMSNKHILIIDDDPDQRLTVRLPLEASGYKVTEAKNSNEGLEMVKKLNPDLIILDVMMDTTTAGFQVAIELKNPDPNSEYREFRNIPIVMVTAIHKTTPLRFSPEEDYLPIQALLEKPVDPEQLLAKIKDLLD